MSNDRAYADASARTHWPHEHKTRGRHRHRHRHRRRGVRTEPTERGGAVVEEEEEAMRARREVRAFISFAARRDFRYECAKHNACPP